MCAKEEDLYGHVRRDADQRDEESCKHGKSDLDLVYGGGKFYRG